ncbi:hypothetical protein AB7M18_003552 [Pseudomonas viridiflava]
MEINAASLRPLVLAAMTLVGGYAQASDQQAPSMRSQVECARSDMESMRGVMSGLVQDWNELEEIYARLLAKTLESDSFDADQFDRIRELLSMTRSLEVTLKAVVPPSSMAGIHMEFRKSVARTRSRLSDLDRIFHQSTSVPHYVDTKIDLNGLRALADITTAGLAKTA